MIPLSRLAVLMIVAFISLVGVPMAFVGSETTLENTGLWLPIFLISELVVYFVFTLATNPRLSIASTALYSILMAAGRCIASLLGFGLAMLVLERQGIGFLATWSGDPVSVVLQVIVLMLVTPHVLEAISPGSVDRETRRKLSGGDRQAPAARTSQDTVVPAGGFIQVFGYEELAATIRKTPGLEGFVIFSNEGLIVWRDLPIRIDTDVLTARMMSASTEMGHLMTEGGLARMRQMVIETREHMVAVMELNANFGLVLVYSAQTNLGDCGQRIGIISKTAREFLQWKYPGLAVTASIQNRTALEAV